MRSPSPFPSPSPFTFTALSFSLLLIFFTFHFISATGTTTNLIDETCKNSTKTDPNVTYKFCVASLEAAPDSHCANLQKLGKISLRLIQYNTTNTRCYIQELLKSQKKLDPYFKQCLMDCFDLYSDAIPTIKQAMKDYRNKRFLDANVKISAAMDAATACEDGFKENEEVVSPLTKRNKDAFQLSAIALSIMKMLR